jgi:hypothetical protein
MFLGPMFIESFKKRKSVVSHADLGTSPQQETSQHVKECFLERQQKFTQKSIEKSRPCIYPRGCFGIPIK